MCYYRGGVIRADTHNPAAFIGGHVTVHLHALAGVSVDVNGVDAAQRLPVQQVLGAILRRRKQTTPWREADEASGGEAGLARRSLLFD